MVSRLHICRNTPGEKITFLHLPHCGSELGMYTIFMHFRQNHTLEGSLEDKLPTILADGKAEVGRVREEKEPVERKSEKRKNQKKEDAGAGKGKKFAKH